MKTKRYTFRVDENTLKRMHDIARQLNTSLPNLIVTSVLHMGYAAQNFQGYAKLASKTLENDHQMN